MLTDRSTHANCLEYCTMLCSSRWLQLPAGCSDSLPACRGLCNMPGTACRVCLIGAARVRLVCPACCATRATHLFAAVCCWLLCSSPGFVQQLTNTARRSHHGMFDRVNIRKTADHACFHAPLTLRTPLLQATCILLHAGVCAVKPDTASTSCSICLTGSTHHDGHICQSLCNSKCTLLLLTCILCCCMQGLCSLLYLRVGATSSNKATGAQVKTMQPATVCCPAGRCVATARGCATLTYARYNLGVTASAAR
jgi:hypothetical protein